MYRLKQIIENVGNDRTDGDIKVAKGIVYITIDGIKYKHEHHNWYMLCGTNWVNLQGGVPDYETETLLDAYLFEETEVTNE